MKHAAFVTEKYQENLRPVLNQLQKFSVNGSLMEVCHKIKFVYLNFCKGEGV
jgi:hypothetical protein